MAESPSSVLDGASGRLEWTYPAGFGTVVLLGDVEGDQQLEIVYGEASFGSIHVWDPRARAPKWSIARGRASPGKIRRVIRTRRAALRPLPAAILLVGLTACRPDPYSLLLRTIEPGEPVALPDGYTLVVDSREGTVLRGVRITGAAKTCEGTLELEAPEVRFEPADGETGPRLVLERPVAEELCGGMKAVTRHERLTWYLEGGTLGGL